MLRYLGALVHDMRTVRKMLRYFGALVHDMRMVRNICVGVASYGFLIILLAVNDHF